MLSVVAIAGLPGSGKTFLASEIIKRTGWRCVSRDAVRVAMFQPCSFGDAEKFAAFEAVLLAVEANLSLGESCVVEGMPFSRAGELERVQAIAESVDARFVAFYLDVASEIAAERVGRDTRLGRGRADAHDRVPSLVYEVVSRMRSFENLAVRLDAAAPRDAVVDAAFRVLHRWPEEKPG